MAVKRPPTSPRGASGELPGAASGRAQHVIPHEGGNWAVKKTGAAKVSRTFSTQAEAIQHGRAVAENAGTVLYVHGRNGRVVSRVPPASAPKKNQSGA